MAATTGVSKRSKDVDCEKMPATKISGPPFRRMQRMLDRCRFSIDLIPDSRCGGDVRRSEISRTRFFETPIADSPREKLVITSERDNHTIVTR